MRGAGFQELSNSPSTWELLALESHLSCETWRRIDPQGQRCSGIGQGMRFDVQSFIQLCFSLSLNSGLLTQTHRGVWGMRVLVHHINNAEQHILIYVRYVFTFLHCWGPIPEPCTQTGSHPHRAKIPSHTGP